MNNVALHADHPNAATEEMSERELDLVSGGRPVPSELARAGVERYGVDDYNAYNDNGH